MKVAAFTYCMIFLLLWFIKHYFLLENPLRLLPLTFFKQLSPNNLTGFHLMLTLSVFLVVDRCAMVNI